MIQVIACNRRDCPWYRVTDIGAMSMCKNPEAAHERVAAKMERGTPELCPVKLQGPYLVVTTDPNPSDQIPRVVASVRRELDDWEALWRQQLDKSL